MSFLQALWLIITVIILGLAFYLIPVLVQLKKTLESVDSVVKKADRDIPSLLNELNETVTHLKNVSANVDKTLTQVSGTVTAVRSAAYRVGSFGKILDESVNPKVLLMAAILLGVEKGIGFIISRGKKKS